MPTVTHPASATDTDPEKNFPDQFYVDPYGVDRYVVQEKTLFEWKTPSKVERLWTRSGIVQLVLFVVLLSLILLLLGDPLLFLVFFTGSILLVLYLTSKPTFLNCKITTLGIKVEDQYYYWPQLSQFWFETKNKTHFLCFRDLLAGNRYRHLILAQADADEVKTTIGSYLLFKKPHQTQLEKMWQSIAEKTPFADELF